MKKSWNSETYSGTVQYSSDITDKHMKYEVSKEMKKQIAWNHSPSEPYS
jgi:hypothetical protein